MPCLVCGEWAVERGSTSRVCRGCRRDLVPAPDQMVGDLYVRAAYLHEGGARALVHRLKYHGMTAAAQPLAEAMIEQLEVTEALVPVPRVLVRKLRYGTDQAFTLARAMGRLTGVAVARVLVASVWGHRQAGRSARARRSPRFSVRGDVPSRFVLIDDVITTGETLVAAHRALGSNSLYAVVATSAERPRPGSQPTMQH